LQRCRGDESPDARRAVANAAASLSAKSRLHHVGRPHAQRLPKADRKDRAEIRRRPLKAMSDPRTRGVFLDWRDELALKSRRQADYVFQVFALVLAWAKGRGKIMANPLERIERVYAGTRIDFVWSTEDEARFLQRAPAHLHLALLMGLW